MPPKPFNMLRDSKASDEAANDLSYRITTWLRMFGPATVVRTCGTCVHMARVGPAICGLAKATPPIATILAGCDKYEDELPRTTREKRRNNDPVPEGFSALDDDIPF